jgi:hypothetical protein
VLGYITINENYILLNAHMSNWGQSKIGGGEPRRPLKARFVVDVITYTMNAIICSV